jgi:ankyrin repeat protein
MAEALLTAGAKVDVRTEYGETPLTLAAANGDAVLVRRLLRLGADPKAARWNGETALMIAAGAGNREAVASLVEAGQT